jgi:extracellular factor (EF) 3-hydroxypalmitic acid methyl ester biosynthesis protein
MSTREVAASEDLIQFNALLDTVCDGIERETFDRLSTLYLGLFGYRRSMSTDAWRERCRIARQHRLNDLVQQSPLTRRAFEKPRGYAGDAMMIDLAYGYGDLPRDITPLGGEIYRFERQIPASKSVRARRDFFATTIDFVASSVRGARILSIACGHLREALCSEAVRSGRVGELIALDQDAASLDLVREYPFKNIRPVEGSVRKILSKGVAFQDLDLVYAAGLYDYLPDSVGQVLTARMFAMLRPGGRCYIVNFAPDAYDIAYLDSYMDWQLIYRDESQMTALTAHVPHDQILSHRVFRDPVDNLVYAELVKA